jgi:hypothetical protein
MKKLVVIIVNILATLIFPFIVLAVTAPSIVVLDASNPAKTTARLNGVVISDGGEDCEVRFGYGTTTQTAPNFASYDTVTAWVAGYNTYDTVNLDITGLVAGTPYFFRVQIKNTNSTVTSVDGKTFTTETDIDDVISFSGIPDDTSISLNWIKGAGATNSLIRFRTDTYPTTTADGTQVYALADNTYNHTGLLQGTTYYYSIWGESGGAYSVNALNLAMTTTSTETSQGALPAISNPSGWNQAPDETPLVHFQPVYSVLNGLADTWGMPRANFWLGVSLLFCMLCGVGIYMKVHAPALALLVMSLVMAGFVALGLLPSFMIALVVILALGSWSTRPQGV